MGQRKNLSHQQASNPWPPKHGVGSLSTELPELMARKVIELSSYVTDILHTAKIIAVEVITSFDKWITIMNFW